MRRRKQSCRNKYVVSTFYTLVYLYLRQSRLSSLIQLLASGVYIYYIIIMVTNDIILSHDYSLQQWIGKRCCNLTNTIEQFNLIVYVHRSEARSGAPPGTLLTAGVPTALPDPHLPATASNMCTTDALPGAPPPPNPGYVGDCNHIAI